MAFQIETTHDEPPATEAPAIPHEEVVAGNTGSKVSGEVVTMTTRTARHLKESTRKLLDGQRPTSEVVAEKVAPPAPDAAPSTPATGDAAPAAVTPAPDAAKPAPVATEPHPDTVRAARLSERNAALLAENEALRKQPHRSGPSDHEKALAELEDLVVTNPRAAHRKLMARAMGVAEDSKDIDPFEGYLESELTSGRIGVPLTEDSEAARKAARTLVAVQREMRARKAEETKPAPTPPDDSGEKEAVSFVGNRIAALKHADRYPLLHGWAEHIDGRKPEELVLALMRHGVDTGELDRNEPIDHLIEKTSKRLEDYYQAKADKLPKAKPSTAQPDTAATDGQKADPPGKAVGTISNAVASVAPATPPPAKKTPETYQSEKQRRIAIIQRNTSA